MREVCHMDSVRLENFGKDLGLMHKMVVTGRKVGTSKELSAFFARLAHDEDLFRSTMDSILNRVRLTATEQLALKILGKGKVIGHTDACRIWQVNQSETEPVMPYSKEIIRQAAECNQNGGEDWRLVYCTGLSLRAQFEIMGDNRKKQPCFDKDYKWWCESQQDEWANKPIEAGYRLLDFSCPFTSKNWTSQNEAITASGDQFTRAEEQAVVEACLSNYIVNNEERLLQDRYHWGHLQASNGYLVCVGYFADSGFFVNRSRDGYVGDRLGVVRAWKSA